MEFLQSYVLPWGKCQRDLVRLKGDSGSGRRRELMAYGRRLSSAEDNRTVQGFQAWGKAKKIHKPKPELKP